MNWKKELEQWRSSQTQTQTQTDTHRDEISMVGKRRKGKRGDKKRKKSLRGREGDR